MSILTLDCTLRDGGYINNWRFGNEAIRSIARRLARSGIEYFEIGFLEDKPYDPDCSIFPGNAEVAAMIAPKDPFMKYLGMIDMGAPLPLDKLGPRRADALDGIRVIFKKNRIAEGYAYCEKLITLGYETFAQLVATNEYSDIELVETVQHFNALDITGLSIVDTFGLIKRRDFLRMVSLIDHNLKEGVALCYHSHNNLQQAMNNAIALVESNLERDVVIDACVFGMGRGAGNLNLELFAEHLNECHGKTYRIEPMLEIVDEYLNEIYRREFWGYSLPYYLSATNGCHPNYAKHFAEKGTLTVKAFNELLRSLPVGVREVYDSDTAETSYASFQENYIEDKSSIDALHALFLDRCILLIGGGWSVQREKEKLLEFIHSENPVVISLNHITPGFPLDFVFCSDIRRYASRIQDNASVRKIITSNIRDAKNYDYCVNFSSFASHKPLVLDNSAIMCLKLLRETGVSRVYLAGMDGYDRANQLKYINSGLEYSASEETMKMKNALIGEEIRDLGAAMSIVFLTRSLFEQP